MNQDELILNYEKRIQVLESLLEDEKRMFIHNTAITILAHNREFTHEQCWKLAEQLWNKKPSHL